MTCFSLFRSILAAFVVVLAPYTWASLRPKNSSPGQRKYGPIIGLTFGPTKAVTLLLEKRSHIYSSRAAQDLLILRELATILSIQQVEAVQTAQRGEDFKSPNIQALYDVQHRFTTLLEPGAAPPVEGISFLRHIPEHTIYLDGILTEDGSDTTGSTRKSFLLAMLENPAALQAAQEEVDRVCGGKKSPTMDDLENLPYIEVCMHEVLRWRPVAAGRIPHMLVQTDTYKDDDEAEYDDPAALKPERFIGGNKYGTKSSTALGPGETRKSSYDFGAGRRICSGHKMAEASIKLNLAKIVWGFSLEKFPIHITPRSEEHAAITQEEFEALKRFYESLSA
ncbi:cytochrome P450 [Aspergillus spinulosporus]